MRTFSGALALLVASTGFSSARPAITVQDFIACGTPANYREFEEVDLLPESEKSMPVGCGFVSKGTPLEITHSEEGFLHFLMELPEEVEAPPRFVTRHEKGLIRWND